MPKSESVSNPKADSVEAVSKSAPKDARSVVLIGAVASGKTTFLAGLRVVAETSRDNEIQVFPGDEDTQSVLDEAQGSLRNGVWPAATTTAHHHEIMIKYRTATIQLTALDYPGEELDRLLETSGSPAGRKLRETLSKADRLLVLIDPLQHVDQGDLSTRRLDSVMRAIQFSVDKNQGRPDSREQQVAVIVTKFDLHLENDFSSKRAVEVLKRSIPPLLRKISAIVPGVSVYPVSCTGAGATEESPPTQLHPRGYEAVLSWLADLDQLDKSAPRRFWRRYRIHLLMLIVSAGIVGALWWRNDRVKKIASLESSRELDALPNIDQRRIDAPLFDELTDSWFQNREAELNELSTINQARGLITRLEDASTNALSADTRLRLLGVSSRANESLEAMIFQRAKDSKGKPIFQEHAQQYIEEYPHGKFSDRIRSWTNAQRNEFIQSLAKIVRDIQITNRDSLTRKSNAIKSYLDQAKDIGTNRNKMQRALELCQLLATKSRWTIRVLAVGEFTGNRDHGFRIYMNDKHDDDDCVFQGGVEEKARHSTYNESKTVDWGPGDSFALVLYDCNWWNQWAAWTKLYGPIAILGCHGRIQLESKADNFSKDDFDGTPYFKAEVEELRAGDLEIARDFIYPGHKW
ncbi:MAG: hypothetical protein V3W41_08430 [Planctomycetota bacterium]